MRRCRGASRRSPSRSSGRTRSWQSMTLRWSLCLRSDSARMLHTSLGNIGVTVRHECFESCCTGHFSGVIRVDAAHLQRCQWCSLVALRSPPASAALPIIREIPSSQRLLLQASHLRKRRVLLCHAAGAGRAGNRNQLSRKRGARPVATVRRQPVWKSFNLGGS